jgi:CelD/BcsL family acetyltransferase involved in cellulose biosynthesis
VFSTWEWANSWHRTIGRNTELAVGIARAAHGSVIAVLPLYLDRQRPLKVARLIGAGPSDELGPVCARSDRAFAAEAMRRHVSDVLGSGGMFLGERLPARDGLAAQLGGTPLRRAASPVLPIAGRTFDDFLASRSRNFREQVRRRERNLARTHRLAYRLTDDPGRLEEDMRTMIRLHNARWQHAGSRAFDGLRAPFHLEFAKSAFERGWLRLWTMELDGAPVAAWYGLRYAGIESYYQAGRDPSLEKLSVGFVLLCHTIRCAFQDGMHEYRFGLGGEAYKSRFADLDPGLETIALSFGVRGRLAVGALRTALRMRDHARGARSAAGLPRG